jgi:hypothetical protein
VLPPPRFGPFFVPKDRQLPFPASRTGCTSRYL